MKNLLAVIISIAIFVAMEILVLGIGYLFKFAYDGRTHLELDEKIACGSIGFIAGIVGIVAFWTKEEN